MTSARSRSILRVAVLALVWVLPPGAPGTAQDAKFTAAFLKDPATIAIGQEVWQARCRFCHGGAAYPGKAPRLDPTRLTPELIYDRVTNGFREMPSWKDEFSDRQRRAVAAYILSPQFSP